jgi:Raf kinase inhibitor-like YbhB/YbcL family protein
VPIRPLAGLVALALAVGGCSDDGRMLEPAPPTTAPAPPPEVQSPSTVASMQLASPQLADGGPIPVLHTCDGEDVAPTLLITGAPTGAAELAVAVVDVAAGGAVHWLVAGMPGDVEVVDPALLPAGAVVGRAFDGRSGWSGPCPPAGDGPHRYEARVYALAEPLGLAADVDGATAVAALEDAAIERDVLTATYER